MIDIKTLPYRQWRVTFGNPRHGTDEIVRVRARTAGEARMIAKENAARKGIAGRLGVIRLDEAEEAA